ncbi:MAG: sugar phosphate isomerase/epimerase, partial [Candidatus Omnitrophica bacterium]|nr:sugar phosphate isomerase/epimerase [Candidatus Omnitrophota bacterium]
MNGDKISLSTVLYDGYKGVDIKVDELIRHIVKVGYKNIEVSGWNMMKNWDFKELVNKTKDAGISILSVHCVHHSELDMRSYEKDVFSEFHQKFYKLLEDVGLGGRVVVEHPPLSENQLDVSLQLLDILRQINKKYNFTIVIENMPNPKREEQLRVLKKLLQEPDIYYCHDINHAAMAGFNPFDFLDFLPKLRNIHVVDTNPLIPFGDGVAPGLGIVPIEEILSKIIKGGYKGSFTLEIYGFERSLNEVLRICSKAISYINVKYSKNLDILLEG